MKIEKTLKNACICCGGDIKVSYVDELTRCYAEACDVCAQCFQLACPGISIIEENRTCNKTGAQSRPLP
jgi:hypothetical protein